VTDDLPSAEQLALSVYYAKRANHEIVRIGPDGRAQPAPTPDPDDVLELMRLSTSNVDKFDPLMKRKDRQ